MENEFVDSDQDDEPFTLRYNIKKNFNNEEESRKQEGAAEFTLSRDKSFEEDTAEEGQEPWDKDIINIDNKIIILDEIIKRMEELHREIIKEHRNKKIELLNTKIDLLKRRTSQLMTPFK